MPRRMMLAVAAMLLAPGAARAQAAGDNGGWSFTIQTENDYFDIVGTHSDRYYTHGTQASFLAPGETLAVLRPLVDRGWLGPRKEVSARYGLSLGQNIYTPERIFISEPDPSDRPYAGWAYVGATAVAHTDEILTSLELQVGVVGPSALAGEAQNGLHRLRKFALAEGWEYQLQDEVAFVLLGERRARVEPFGPVDDGFGMDGIVDTGLALGTVRIAASGGATLRLGWGLADDFGAPRIRPAFSPPPFYRDTHDWSLYGFFGARVEAVGRDIFLDGNTWQDSPSVDRRWLVPEAQAGVVGRWGRVRATYAWVWRGEEFEGQNGEAEFGAFSITYEHPLN